MKRWSIIFVISAIIFTGCERSVDFDIKQSEPKLVVEATIENNMAPVVYLSRSYSFFSTIDLADLEAGFVHDAEIYVSNGALTHKLKEYSVPVSPVNKIYYYSSDPASPATIFTGELKKQYSLRIVSGGKEYTATTTIPDTTRRIDTMFWKPAPGGNDPGKVALMIRAYDPPGFGDYTRYFTKRNNEPFYPGYTSVYDDQVIDGSSFEVQVERGIDRNLSQPEGFSYFDKGDTVTLKLCNIDKATYDFWRTMEYTYASVGNPFATPTKVVSNIKGGALGYFGGYGAMYRTIIIPQ